MSKPDIWMPLYIGDYLAATAHLEAQESGAYLHLLMHSWKNGSLPADLELLRRIARVPKDAWSIAWPMLKPFFEFDSSGLPSQARLERIRGEWSQKKENAVDKAKRAAEARWKKDAPSIPQAMLEQCPSPIPSPIPKKTTTKPSREKREGPTKTAIIQTRHDEFKSAIGEYWQAKNPGVEMPWNGAEGKQLGVWLGASPTTSLEQFKGFLRNRFKSEVNHAERPSVWINHVTSYAAGPLNKFKQPRSLDPSPVRKDRPTDAHMVGNGNEMPEDDLVALRAKIEANKRAGQAAFDKQIGRIQ